MSERDEQDQQDRESQGQESEGQDTQGVDTDPDGKTAIAVDTTERLEGRDEERDFDDIPEDELEEERQKRLDPDNRPDNTEVDNSDRDFNPETGLFEDSDVDPPEEAPFSTTEAEQSNSGSGEGESSSDSEDSES